MTELYFIQYSVCHETTDRTNKRIRSTIRLLQNEAFIKEHGILFVELVELFSHLESDQSTVLQCLMEGFVHLSTRCDIIQLLANDEYIYRHVSWGCIRFWTERLIGLGYLTIDVLCSSNGYTLYHSNK